MTGTYFDAWERWAYRIDVYRVVPRAVLLVYALSAWRVSEWFMGLKDPTGAQGAFISVVAGIAPLLFQFYSANGIDWEKRMERLMAAGAK